MKSSPTVPDHVTLNPRQKQILDFLHGHAQSHRYPPTVREIGRAVGLSSSSTVQNHLDALEQHGLIRRDPSKSRTLEVVGAGAGAQAVVALPLVGRVAAGSPILAQENIEDTITVGSEIAKDDGSFALMVHGDSMVNAGILDGDLVIVKPRHDPPANGSIVVARIDNETTGEPEVTVKRFFRDGKQVRLMPENPAYQPLVTNKAHVEGQVTAVIRLL